MNLSNKIYNQTIKEFYGLEPFKENLKIEYVKQYFKSDTCGTDCKCQSGLDVSGCSNVYYPRTFSSTTCKCNLWYKKCLDGCDDVIFCFEYC